MKHSMQLLQEAAAKYGPLCVGLDTSASYIPSYLIQEIGSPTEAVLQFNKAIIAKIAQEKAACCFKIQIAYYEAMGLEGLKVYAETLKAVKDSGFIAISDIKRGDIAATADAYAKAHFSGDFETDIITVNPYMGFDTLKSFSKYCLPENGAKGYFVLLRTSNPGMKDIEQLELKTGGRVLDSVGSELSRLANDFSSQYADCKCSPVGAVVGCTEESDARFLRDAYPNIFFLIPGYGKQGGDARICATLLDKAGGVVNSSRGILCAWEKDALLSNKVQSQSLTIEDLAEAALRASIAAKNDLLTAYSNLSK